jgi:indole-3-glycerol phosphate synthase
MPPPLSLSRSILAEPGVSLIAEVKKASPSAGPIRPGCVPADVARIYETNGARAVSVLTEPEFFDGDPEYLSQVREAVSLPVLCKDFILSPGQVYQARLLGADAVLLIMRILDDEQYRVLSALAGDLGMECLTEVHDEAELDRAIRSEARLIGINNRNLRNLETDLDVTARLVGSIPSGRVVVAASGVKTRENMAYMHSLGVDAVLVGTSLMRAPDIGAKVRELVGAGR